MLHNTVPSQRNRLKVVHNGYLFVKEKVSASGDIVFWRCDKRNYNCRCRIHTKTDTNEVVRQIHEHNHEPSKKRGKVVMKAPSGGATGDGQEALDPDGLDSTPVADVKSEPLSPSQQNEDEKASLPSYFASAVESYSPPEGPTEDLLLLDSNSGSHTDFYHRVRVFGYAANMEWASEMEDVFLDSAPPQLIFISAKQEGRVRHVLTALVPDRSRQSYRILLEMISWRWPLFGPKRVFVDFERPALLGVADALPRATSLGCRFHLVKAVRRQLQEHFLMEKYAQDMAFALQARSILALAFVPVADLELAVEKLSGSWNEEERAELGPILDWFEDNFLGRRDRSGRRRPAAFPVEAWNLHERELRSDPKKSHAEEELHERVREEFGLDETSPMSPEHVCEMLARWEAEGEEQPKDIERTLVDEHLHGLLKLYKAGNVLEFLKAVAYNIRIN